MPVYMAMVAVFGGRAAAGRSSVPCFLAGTSTFSARHRTVCPLLFVLLCAAIDSSAVGFSQVCFLGCGLVQHAVLGLFAHHHCFFDPSFSAVTSPAGVLLGISVRGVLCLMTRMEGMVVAEKHVVD